MKDKTHSEEFNFIRCELEKVMSLILHGEASSLIEAAFKLGCLHTICVQNAERFREVLDGQ